MTRASAGIPLDGSGPIQHVGSLTGRHADPAGDIDRISATEIHRRRTAQMGAEPRESPPETGDERGRHLRGMHRRPDVGHRIIVRPIRRHRKSVGGSRRPPPERARRGERREVGSIVRCVQSTYELRREGLYTSHISEWRNQRARRDQPATASKDRRRRSAEQAELDRLRKKNAKLESELERTKLALEITGKAHALLELLSESADIDPKYKQ